MEHEAGKNAERNCEYPKENVIGNHKHFCVTTATQNTFCHNAVCGAENYDNADCGHELLCDFYSFLADIVS